MTIGEAIIHCEEVAIRKLKNGNNANCVQCGEEHVQLAKWLKELRDYKSREDVVPVVHGEWEDKEVIHKRCIEEWQSARCSACGKYHTTPYMYYFDDFKFCPNCGAKMDGERKE